jgi:hypothetical protein
MHPGIRVISRRAGKQGPLRETCAWGLKEARGAWEFCGRRVGSVGVLRCSRKLRSLHPRLAHVAAPLPWRVTERVRVAWRRCRNGADAALAFQCWLACCVRRSEPGPQVCARDGANTQCFTARGTRPGPVSPPAATQRADAALLPPDRSQLSALQHACTQALRDGRLVEHDAVELLLEPAHRKGHPRQHPRTALHRPAACFCLMFMLLRVHVGIQCSQAKEQTRRACRATNTAHHLMASSLVTLCFTPTRALHFRRRATR